MVRMLTWYLVLGTRLAALWPVEDDPGDEVFREILEAMDLSGWHKQQIAGNKAHPLAAAHELP